MRFAGAHKHHVANLCSYPLGSFFSLIVLTKLNMLSAMPPASILWIASNADNF